MIVDVIPTAFLSLSTIEKCEVPPSKGTPTPTRLNLPPYSPTPLVLTADVFEASPPTNASAIIASTTAGTFSTKSGSPRLMRRANECLNDSMRRCEVREELQLTGGLGRRERKSRAISTVAPPEEGGGTPSRVKPLKFS